MKERLLEFLKNENKSSAQLAEEIGVQASGISHILSGRNNPSLDFILKMLGKYQFLSTDWLLFGRGPMYKEAKMQNLFDNDPAYNREIQEIQTKNELLKKIQPEFEYQETEKDNTKKDSPAPSNKSASGVIKIVWFYENNSFEEFLPRR
jgi:transcriptional regulator with XRE-family HTH domain